MKLRVPKSWTTTRLRIFAVGRCGPDDPRCELHFSAEPALRWWARPLVWALVIWATIRPDPRANGHDPED